ncbi:MAG: protein tyrosine phosphatase [Candidatus Binatia bacterium]
MTHHLRTSSSHPICVDFLPLPTFGGRVGLTFAPGKRDGFKWDRSLAQDLDRLVDAYDVTHVVSLMEDEELQEYQIPDLVTQAELRGIAVHRFPIVDVSVPEQLDDVRPLVQDIGTWAQVATVAIHCLGGLGRTGTIAGCFLVEQGCAPETALTTLRTVRGDDCPQTEEQREFVRRYARWRRTRVVRRNAPV